ncbi:PRC-barrel domain containing protein [Baekduia soli]|uniref:PRC-barrel domain containing protein n=1 Tax=Baekduia soli TaxID=496014 RepID=A0A5B8U7L4_9ACTN|nr:PRC-barrel domain-containing protein [Baekduia soli]QEC48818.1 PRC-barrel domain containing protein [Baekduia soli]
MSTPPAAASPIVAESIIDWKGQDVVDAADEKLGKLAEVLYDVETDVPAFIAVKSGVIGKHLTLVPLAGASVAPGHVRVAWSKADVKDAPSYDTDAELTLEDEAEAFRFYGLAHTPAGQGARRLARR